MLPGMQRALLHLDELEERPTAETAVQRTVTANAPAADYRRGEGWSIPASYDLNGPFLAVC